MTAAADARIVVSIINYRTAEMTIRCLASVLSDLRGLNASVVVVDNASGDGSADRIDAWIATQDAGTPVKLVRSPVNTGFSGGHNIGIAAAEGDFYLILNSDAELRPGFFSAMLDATEASPEAGLFAPAIEREDGSIQNSCFRFPTPVSEFIRGACSGPVTRALSKWDQALGPDPAEEDVRWASFACILLRATMIREVGPLDEGYFMYFEDIDYCREARRRGWRIRRVPEARVLHLQGGSGPVKKLKSLRKRMPPYFYASRSRFFYRSYGWAGLFAANVAWHAGRAIAQTRRLMGMHVHSAVESEGRDIWINAAKPLGPRYAPGDAA